MRKKVVGKKRGMIFVISGPSGSGKTTLAEALLKDKLLKASLVKPAAFTTRPKRSTEKNGEHYYFIGVKDFRRELASKKILEWTRYLGYYYATSKKLIERYLRRGKHIILCLDLKGARRIKKIYPLNTVTIFVLPPSLRVLRERISLRCKGTCQREIKDRLALAKRELLSADGYDFRVVNKNLWCAVKELRRIILEKTGEEKNGLY